LKQFVLGGVRSGKSRLAQRLALACKKPVTYIATATAEDEEMQRRIQSHQQNRPSEWVVVEEPYALGRVIQSHGDTGNCLLIDCLTLWLTNLLCANDEAQSRTEIDCFLQQLETTKCEIIIVSNETGLGVIPQGELSRRFCDEAGILHQAVAALCDRVIMTVAGLPCVIKGEKIES